jgi:hypothetical protein
MSSPGSHPQPVAIWKNIVGHEALLGTATHPSTSAPSVVLTVAQIGLPIDLTFQGIQLDPGSPQGQAAVTNAVLVRSR